MALLKLDNNIELTRLISLDNTRLAMKNEENKETAL